MKIVSIGILMISGACVALGIIHFRFWLAERQRRDYLAFALSCLFTALFSWCELGMMHSATPDEFLFYAWWSQIPGSFALISVAWFAYLNLVGRRWLFWTFCASRILVLAIHLIIPNGINYRVINAVEKVTVLGETLSYPIAVRNPWMLIAQVSHFLLIFFCLDASIRTWRRGNRRAALAFGTGITLFGMTALMMSVGVVWGFVQLPVIISVSIAFIVMAMVDDLTHRLQYSAILSDKLIEREIELNETLQKLNLSAGAGSVGLWTRRLGDDKLWISPKVGEFFGFPEAQSITRKDFLERIHPEDRELVQAVLKENGAAAKEFHVEYRVLLENGHVRWLDSRGEIEQNGDEPKVIRGAVVDITRRKNAEKAMHELSRKLMNAQEQERARLARELHDDLSQSLALLSIELALLCKGNDGPDFVKNQINQLISQTEQLSADVRRISHELHPAKISQLGLETALRGFCRELAAVHPLLIEFEAEDVPRSLPNDISLCLYRVTQESLQNVVKHSRAASARVSIKFINGEIRLVISDNGCGFDPKAAKSKESLGLVSMDERILAVNGTLKVESEIGAGTKIEACVPVVIKVPQALSTVLQSSQIN